jgi:hypothetical protein
MIEGQKAFLNSAESGFAFFQFPQETEKGF